LAPELPKIECPTLVVVPGGDPIHGVEEYRVLERLTSPGHGRRSSFQQLEHRGRDHGGGQARRLRLVLIGQQPRAGHVEIDDAAALQRARSDEATNRRLYPKADQLHGLLQLSA